MAHALKGRLLKLVIFSLFIQLNIGHAKIFPEVCEEFQKYPETFHEIKASSKDGSFTYTLKNNSKISCTPGDAGGTCHTKEYSCSGNNEYTNKNMPDGYTFGISETPVSFKENLYFFINRYSKGIQNAETIILQSERGRTILCDITLEIIEINHSLKKHPICDALTQNKVETIDLLSTDIKFDLKRDGSQISFKDDGFSSGAGCGNTLVSYEAESSSPKDTLFVKAFNALNSNEDSYSQDLPLSWEVIRFNKKDYLYLHNKGFTKGKQIRPNKMIQPDSVYEWDGSNWIKLCSTEYKTQRKVIDPVY